MATDQHNQRLITVEIEFTLDNERSDITHTLELGGNAWILSTSQWLKEDKTLPAFHEDDENVKSQAKRFIEKTFTGTKAVVLVS